MPGGLAQCLGFKASLCLQTIARSKVGRQATVVACSMVCGHPQKAMAEFFRKKTMVVNLSDLRSKKGGCGA